MLRMSQILLFVHSCCFPLNYLTLYTVDATEYVTAQTDATFHEGREKWKTVS